MLFKENRATVATDAMMTIGELNSGTLARSSLLYVLKFKSTPIIGNPVLDMVSPFAFGLSTRPSYPTYVPSGVHHGTSIRYIEPGVREMGGN